jgi:hypothetical protein
MLHNPSYDFNDELIPLGATAWVRLAERWLATPRPRRRRDEMNDAERFFAQSYAEARGKFTAAAEAAGLDVHAHRHPLLGRDGEVLAMDVARFGAADAPRAARRQQRLPRRGRFLRLGRAERAAGRRGLSTPRRRPPAWPCCTCTR